MESEELLNVVADSMEEELLDVTMDTVEGGLFGIMTGTVAGAMVSSHSEARKPARLCLKSLKFFLVIILQSTMGEPSASQ